MYKNIVKSFVQISDFVIELVTSVISSRCFRSVAYILGRTIKVPELATVCLPWQHWTKALVWFDDVDISAFHTCVVVDLWQSLSEWHLLMSACVLVCRRENVGA